jgi:FkbM family methyltransferase
MLCAKAMHLLYRDPTGFVRRCGDQFVPLPRRVIFKNLNHVTIPCDLSLSWPGRDMERKMFFGTYEPETVAAMKRFLRPGHAFIDVGANVGYLSAVAMGLVTNAGEVHSFEPVAEYRSRLEKIGHMNPNFQLFANGIALSDLEGTGEISISAHNIGWNTMVPNFMPSDDLARSCTIRTARLDNYIRRYVNCRVSLIKVDTEGFEFPVLLGLEGFFRKGNQPPIVCEVAPSAYAPGKLDRSLADFSDYMWSYGYVAMNLQGTESIKLANVMTTTNLLWIARESRSHYVGRGDR